MVDQPHLPVRSDLAGIEPYVSPQLPAEYRMNTNESPYPPPQELVDEVADELRNVRFNRYPDRDASALFGLLAEDTRWPREGLWIANGSNEVFLHLFLTFGGPERKVLTFEPTYSLHSLIARITGTSVVSAERDENWEVTVALAEAAITQHAPDIVVFCSPNNPTGNLERWDAIEVALQRAPLVVVDEAYVDFAGTKDASVASRLAEHPNLVITDTFSKAWSLAAARLGFLMAAPAVVEAMLKVRLPYHLSAVSQALGAAALRHRTSSGEILDRILVERDRIAEALESLDLHVYPSDANFVLFEVGERSAAVWQALLDRGVLVRNYPNHPRLGSCLRVTAGLPEETDAFLTALKEVL